MNGNIKPIETTYKNRRYRSRLEARCQILLDEAGCRNYYEPEGYQFRDGTRYLPDFYLPDQDAFLECKGVIHQADVRKIYLLVRGKW